MWTIDLDPIWRVELDPLMTLVTVGMVLVLFLIAKKEVDAVHRTSKEQLDALNRTSRAALLEQLDVRSSSPPIQAGLRKIAQLESEAKAQCQGAPPNEQQQSIRAYCSRKLREAMSQDPDTYTKMMETLSFFETVGYLARKGYVAFEDIHKLYANPVVRVWDVFEAHIDDYRQDLGASEDKGAGLLEHFKWLANECKRGLSETPPTGD